MGPPAAADDLVVESVFFPAGPYRLEGALAYAGGAPAECGVVVAGPHPLLGGSMDNNVVRALGGGLAARGVPTLRFNYRGVGGSEGVPADVAAHLAEFWATSHVADEPAFREDLAAAAAFLRDAAGGAGPALVGYSFGCSLLPHAGAAADTPLVLVAPTVGTHDYDAFAVLPNPLLVVASDDDFAANAGRLRAWFDQLPGSRRLVTGRRDNHFFRGHEDWLAATVYEFLQEQGRAPAWS
jgi:alpha/beta superfamily hydrolase